MCSSSAESALEGGIRALCVISAGFAEIGEEGRARQEQLLALVRAHGGRLVGPNCLGIAVAAPSLNATFGPRALPPGPIGFSSQSGALGLALLEKASERNLGFSSFISIGNKADVSSNDLLEYWEEDESTELIALYLESFGNPRRFGQIASRVARKKPILAMKSGTSTAGARAAGSHTAALAGSEEAVEALFHQAGVLRAGTLEELIDAAALLSTQPLPRGRRVALLTNAGGLGILCSDACEAAGLELSELTAETTAQLAELPARRGEPRQPGRHARLGDRVQLRGDRAHPARRSRRRLGDRPLRPAGHRRRRGRRGGPRPDAGVRVDGQARSRRAAQRRGGSPRRCEKPRRRPLCSRIRSRRLALSGSRPRERSGSAGRRGRSLQIDRIDTAAAQRIVSTPDDRWLTPAETRELLSAYGLPLVEERLAETVDGAVEAAGELGVPGRRQVGHRGRAQDGDRRRGARSRRRGRGPRGSRANRRAGARAADDQGRYASSSPASSRTRPSARWSPSGLAACSRS